jgi:hypothetical protein
MRGMEERRRELRKRWAMCGKMGELKWEE